MATLTWVFRVSFNHPLHKFDGKLWSIPRTSNLERHIEIKKQRGKVKTVKSYLYPSTTPLTSTSSATPIKHISQFPFSTSELSQNQTQLSHPTSLYATLNSPKGFGPSPKETKKSKNPKKGYENDDEEEEEEEREEGVIPEIVTNRMIKRMGVSVGAPLFMGLLFFPFFYYLKVGLKIDVPTWVPFIVSFIFFGTALLGVSYGIVSASWDPMRDGSLLGWNEAQKNWPVFWQSFRGGSPKK